MAQDNADDLAYEAATNRRYLEALAERLERRVEISVTANAKWVEHIPRSGLSIADLGPLVARVGLDREDDDLGTAFYIGARWLSGFDHPVVSWDAPVAKIFYEPGGNKHDLSERVIVRRTLLERLNEIVKVYDAWDTQTIPKQSPFRAKKLEVPSAPRSADRRPSTRATPPPLSPLPPVATPPQESTALPRHAPSQPGAATQKLEQGMRSADAVNFALNAPRSAALSSVLSTLQPDQYRLVSHPADQPLVIQGHPGTGKTIIGLHRAAYLVSQERSAPERISRLLFLGPTDEWVRHVSDIIKTLDIQGHVTVKSIPAWLTEVSGIKGRLSGDIDGSVEDVAKFVKDVVERAAELCRQDQPWSTGTDARIKNLERLYTVVRDQGLGSSPLKLGPIATKWVRTLPKFGQASRRRRYLPLFAQSAIAILGGAPIRYDHVIVDEAQDISGLEWEIIRSHNPVGGWTLVGDMNQRRTDFGFSTWEALIERLSLTTNGEPSKPQTIERGYRSTQPILNFAKPLLPRGERTAQSLQQDGPPPKVTRVTRAKDRDPIVVSEALRLHATYPKGTIAVIAVAADIDGLERTLLSTGWRRSEHTGDWRKNESLIAMRTPESARGVEFDGVVVVEPSAFPRNLARVGPLYTSLTRANRELAVVHHSALPNELRKHDRH